MQIVIDIPENTYKRIQALARDNYFEHDICGNSMRRIANGTPLSKHHGRIMDVDKIVKRMEEREERLKDDRSMYETSCVETAIDMFGKTIIEADTEREDKG